MPEENLTRAQAKEKAAAAINDDATKVTLERKVDGEAVTWTLTVVKEA